MPARAATERRGDRYLLIFLAKSCSAVYDFPAMSRSANVPLGHTMEGSACRISHNEIKANVRAKRRALTGWKTQALAVFSLSRLRGQVSQETGAEGVGGGGPLDLIQS